jgi:hypothetical protein
MKRLLPQIILFGYPFPKTFLENLKLFFFYVSLALAYIATYSAIEADSPSLLILIKISQAGDAGIDKLIFDKLWNDDLLVMPRIQDLVNDQMIYLENDRLKISKKGEILVSIFLLYRKIINAPKGG